mmetsp:Transcript_40498/g.126692  ORF Transcript_40498/g.126692 Transcript_40498/m.126692 type:complete len:227 (-) Transcript_40498:74-754(-)
MWQETAHDSIAEALGLKGGAEDVKLKTRGQVMTYLSNRYLAGDVPMHAMRRILAKKRPDINKEIYVMLPKEEQPKHEYLLPEHGDPFKGKSPEDLYRQGTINIQTYDDMKYPERKAERERREKDYPTAERMYRCVACRGEDKVRPSAEPKPYPNPNPNLIPHSIPHPEPEPKANIKCMHCKKRICRECLARYFDTDGLDPFLTLHHRFCLRFGRPTRHLLPPIASL